MPRSSRGTVIFWGLAVALPLAVAAAAGGEAVDRALRFAYATDPPSTGLHFDYYYHRSYLLEERPVLVALGLFALVAACLPRAVARGSAGAEPRGGGEAAPRTSGRTRFALAAAAAALLGAVVIGRSVLADFPNSADEWAFQLQAKTFADGVLWRDAGTHPLAPVLGTSYFVAAKDGKVFATHFPGWAALLALGYRLRVPYLINPVLGALTVLFVFLAGKELYGATEASIAAALCAGSPFFLMNSASYFSQATSLFCSTLTLWAFARTAASESLAAGLVGGAAVGLQFLTRPYSALVASLPVAVALLLVRRDPSPGRTLGRRALAWGAPFAAAAAVLLCYDRAITGHAFLSPYGWAGNPHVPGFYRAGYVVHTPLDGLIEAAGHLVDLHAWVAFGGLLLLVPFVFRETGWRERLLLAVPASVILGYFAFASYGGNQYGPRYWYEILAPLCLLMGRGSVLLREDLERRFGRLVAGRACRALVAMMCIGDLALLTYHATVQHRIVAERTVALRMATARDLSHAVVLLATGSGTMERADLVRNDPCCEGDLVWADAPAAVESEAGAEAARKYASLLRAAFADRRVWVFRYGKPGERGSEEGCVTWPLPRSADASELREVDWESVAAGRY